MSNDLERGVDALTRILAQLADEDREQVMHAFSAVVQAYRTTRDDTLITRFVANLSTSLRLHADPTFSKRLAESITDEAEGRIADGGSPADLAAALRQRGR